MLIEYNDACGSYRHALKTVIVKLADGSERNLLEVMTNVINHWESRLHTLGVLTSARVFSYEDPNRLRTRSECNGGLLDLEVDRGQRFLQRMQLLRFNETTGKAEPVDLTGATIHGVIYKPSYEFEVSLSHDATGKKFKKSVLLTESESMELHALSTDAEREAFALATQTAKDALHELAVAVGLQQSSDSTGNGEHVE
ncbi:MAG: hypothetical protein EBZ48_13530 [Proteobacteria bacterium]|nr:hypothetical protein [Pseudomonadota bacterium]